MKIKRIICVLLTAVTVFTCLPFSVSAKEIITADYVEDEVVFEYAPADILGRCAACACGFPFNAQGSRSNGAESAG